MANFSPSSILVTLVIFAIVFSPPLPSEAARLTHRELSGKLSCGGCDVCCEPPPHGSCCRCCGSQINTQSGTESPCGCH
ncbi:unnamed protein product [Ilex paraguariensis]|uniref:Uncharacterized protein n=1 Tax=Ilex paraguariensis TaxID=185542 RepID=A0ABC8T7G0_9AQUA